MSTASVTTSNGRLSLSRRSVRAGTTTGTSTGSRVYATIALESDTNDRENDIDDIESATVGLDGNRDDAEPWFVALETERQSRHHGQYQHRIKSIRDYYARE